MSTAVAARRSTFRPTEQSSARLPVPAEVRRAPVTAPRLDAAFGDNAPAAVRALLGRSAAIPASFRLPSGPGHALPDGLRAAAEQFFQHDFSTVRLHVGPEAGALGARAFTAGERIVLAPGAYAPGTLAGRELLGHELAHVVQQRTGRARATPGGGLTLLDDPRLEAEADRLGSAAATRAADSVPAPPEGDMPGLPRAPLQRKIEVTDQPKWVEAQLQKLVGPQNKAAVTVKEDSSVVLVAAEGFAVESPAVRLLTRLIESKHTLKISPHDKDLGAKTKLVSPDNASNPELGSGAEIAIGKGAQRSLVLSPAGDFEEEDTPAWLILGHELIHADRSTRGMRAKPMDWAKYEAAGKWRQQKVTGTHETRREETETVGLTPSPSPGERAIAVTENSIRAFHQLPLVALYETEYRTWLEQQIERNKAASSGAGRGRGAKRSNEV